MILDTQISICHSLLRKVILGIRLSCQTFWWSFLSGRCLHFISPFGRFYEELKDKSSLSIYLLPVTVSLLSLLSIFLSGVSNEVFVLVHNIKYDLKVHMRPLLCLVFFLISGLDQITTLTYVLMGIFCPCFNYFMEIFVFAGQKFFIFATSNSSN